MSNILKKIVIKKNKGNVTSLIIGQMFMLVLIIWCMFNFRLSMLNTLFNYIDDSLTSSLLGGALVNVEEYGKSNQLIIHNNDVYKDISGTYNGWEKWEADILLSELNYGSDITLSYSELEPKQTLDLENRNSKTTYRDSSTEWYKDYYLRKSISAFLGNMYYNTSNGRVTSNENVENILDDVNLDGALANGKLIIPKSVIAGTFLEDYIVGDIEVTRFDIYNVYKANLAKKHVYKSEFFTVPDNGNRAGIVYKQTKSVVNPYDDETYTLDTQENFDKVYLPSQYFVDGTENENYSRQLEDYDRLLARYTHDLEILASGQSLVCYTNTKTSYQGEYDSSKIPFNYFFCNAGSNNFNITSTSNARKINSKERAPIVGYSVYSYRNNYMSDVNNGQARQYVYSPGTTLSYNSTVIEGTDTNKIKITDGAMAGAEIENTSMYVELTFTVRTFPKMTTGIQMEEGVTQTVTVARLIDIELNTD